MVCFEGGPRVGLVLVMGYEMAAGIFLTRLVGIGDVRACSLARLLEVHFIYD